jgi:hypothetical protein
LSGFGDFYLGATLITLVELVVFIPTIIFPIGLSFQFQAKQRKQINEMQRVQKVEQLLAFPHGYELFSSYCQTVSHTMAPLLTIVFMYGPYSIGNNRSFVVKV